MAPAFGPRSFLAAVRFRVYGATTRKVSPSQAELLYRAGRCLLCGACIESCPESAISLETKSSVEDPRPKDSYG